MTQERKDDAETGTIHTTARRLGALFEGICPSTPKLVKAYGTRVSEISEASTTRTKQAKNSIFAAHSGVDGASIWAAATSSTTAIHVQLLACMLARMWSGPEATSAWFEIVKERKKAVATQYEQGESINFSTLAAAAQIHIPRSQLADWDASARAWLRTADSIKSREQAQLMSVLDSVSVLVNRDHAVFPSVISAWTSALESMERIISGMPQAVNAGATLLSLGAWYLYPDILILGHETAELRFSDPLITPGGTLTVGLAKSREDDHRGVYWSLSLAHLRYYGHPVLAERQLSRESARVTFLQFCQAQLGCLMGGWEMSEGRISIITETLVAIEDALEWQLIKTENHVADNETNETIGEVDSPPADRPDEAIVAYFQDPSHWFHLMADAARANLDEDVERRTTANRLIRQGLRRSASLIESGDNSTWGEALFGLATLRSLYCCLDGPEARITFLRYYADKYLKSRGNMIIRSHYSVNPSRSATDRAFYATAVPRRQKSSKRKLLAQDVDYVLKHNRWLIGNEDYVQNFIHLGDDVEEIT